MKGLFLPASKMETGGSEGGTSIVALRSIVGEEGSLTVIVLLLKSEAANLCRFLSSSGLNFSWNCCLKCEKSIGFGVLMKGELPFLLSASVRSL